MCSVSGQTQLFLPSLAYLYSLDILSTFTCNISRHEQHVDISHVVWSQSLSDWFQSYDVQIDLPVLIIECVSACVRQL